MPATAAVCHPHPRPQARDTGDVTASGGNPARASR